MAHVTECAEFTFMNSSSQVWYNENIVNKRKTNLCLIIIMNNTEKSDCEVVTFIMTDLCCEARSIKSIIDMISHRKKECEECRVVSLICPKKLPRIISYTQNNVHRQLVNTKLQNLEYVKIGDQEASIKLQSQHTEIKHLEAYIKRKSLEHAKMQCIVTNIKQHNTRIKHLRILCFSVSRLVSCDLSLAYSLNVITKHETKTKLTIKHPENVVSQGQSSKKVDGFTYNIHCIGKGLPKNTDNGASNQFSKGDYNDSLCVTGLASKNDWNMHTFVPYPSTFLQVYPVFRSDLDYSFQRIVAGIDQHSPEIMSFQEHRLSSFRNYAFDDVPRALHFVRAGWYATGNEKETACCTCGLKFTEWTSRHNPMEIHKELSPQCPFINGEDNQGRPGTVEYNTYTASANTTSNLLQDNWTTKDAIEYGAEEFQNDSSTMDSSLFARKCTINGRYEEEPRRTINDLIFHPSITTTSHDAGVDLPNSDTDSDSTLSIDGEISVSHFSMSRSLLTPNTNFSKGSSSTMHSSESTKYSIGNVSHIPEYGFTLPNYTPYTSSGNSDNSLPNYSPNASSSNNDYGLTKCTPNTSSSNNDYGLTKCTPNASSGNNDYGLTKCTPNVPSGNDNYSLPKHAPDASSRNNDYNLPKSSPNASSSNNDYSLPKCTSSGNNDYSLTKCIPNAASGDNEYSRLQTNFKSYSLIFPQYESLISRINSYKGSPAHTKQCDRTLAQAGFFYRGFSDRCACFCCGIGLHTWTKDKDPWIEHAQWSPYCKYVIHCRGQDFIVSIQQRNVDPMYPQPSMDPEFSVKSLDSQNSSERILAVEQLHEMGFTDDIIYSAIDKTNNRPITAENIANCILDTISYTDETSEYAECHTDKVSSVQLPIETALKATCGQSTVYSASGQSAIATTTSLHDDAQFTKGRLMCKICFDKTVAITFLPCGHIVACKICSNRLHKCPICRKFIHGKITTDMTE